MHPCPDNDALQDAARRYNVLQKLSYLLVLFGVLPLTVLTGLAMSPRLDSVLPGWVELFGGRQSARTLHFVAASLLLFVGCAVESFAHIGGGKGGYWEDDGYEWNAAI